MDRPIRISLVRRPGRLIAVLAVGAILAGCTHVQSAKIDRHVIVGSVPEDYRTAYQFLGAWAIAADQGKGSQQLHIVYASPGTVAAYRKNGSFPDDSVLVKEVFETTTGPMTTGTVSSAQTLKGWFVMVRDSKNTRPDNKLWGDGWGWSWFDAGNPTKTTSTDYKVNCLGCHVPAQATKWIYVNGYPPLRG